MALRTAAGRVLKFSLRTAVAYMPVTAARVVSARVRWSN